MKDQLYTCAMLDCRTDNIERLLICEVQTSLVANGKIIMSLYCLVW